MNKTKRQWWLDRVATLITIATLVCVTLMANSIAHRIVASYERNAELVGQNAELKLQLYLLQKHHEDPQTTH